MDQAGDNHCDALTGKVGVLLINLGTPDGTDYWSMRRYLNEFLSDRRVIEINPLKWQPLLQAVILTTRPGRSGKSYDAIWNRENNESPLRTVTRAQAEGLATGLQGHQGKVLVDWAMRYGTPSIAERLGALKERGCDRILLAPLYPQYCAATTATANDKAFDALKSMRWQPAIRTLPPYFDHAVYIDALASTLNAHFKSLDWIPEHVLMSFHGLPQAYFDKGDPYPLHCQETARLLGEHLNWDKDFFTVAFQSRFGRAQWIMPATDESLARLGDDGAKRIAVITPGFSVDCVETLEEIALAGKEIFLKHGGEKFTHVPCLNASKSGMLMLKTLIEQELCGWI